MKTLISMAVVCLPLAACGPGGGGGGYGDNGFRRYSGASIQNGGHRKQENSGSRLIATDDILAGGL